MHSVAFHRRAIETSRLHVRSCRRTSDIRSRRRLYGDRQADDDHDRRSAVALPAASGQELSHTVRLPEHVERRYSTAFRLLSTSAGDERWFRSAMVILPPIYIYIYIYIYYIYIYIYINIYIYIYIYILLQAICNAQQKSTSFGIYIYIYIYNALEHIN